MFSIRLTLGLALGLCLVALPAEAQDIGGFIKRKVKEAVGQSPQTEAQEQEEPTAELPDTVICASIDRACIAGAEATGKLVKVDSSLGSSEDSRPQDSLSYGDLKKLSEQSKARVAAQNAAVDRELKEQSLRRRELARLSPDVLDRFESALVTEAAEWKKAAPGYEGASGEYAECVDEEVSQDPRSEELDAQWMQNPWFWNLPSSQAAQAKLNLEICGPDPAGAPSIAAAKAAGLTVEQYKSVEANVAWVGWETEDVCPRPRIKRKWPRDAGSTSAGEVTLLRPRCAKLIELLDARTKALKAVDSSDPDME